MMSENLFYLSKFEFKKFLKLLPNKKNKILDFGCGNGVYNKSYSKKYKISKIYMYDKNKSLKKFIIKKYVNNSLFQWVNNLNFKYNIVLINSVAQYMDLIALRKNINFFFQVKDVDKIIISDIPKYNRLIEGFLLIFLNPLKLVKSISYLFNTTYLNEKYNHKNVKILKQVFCNYKIKKYLNLNDDKMLRYTAILQKKK